MFLQIMSKFRTPGNKRSFVRSARSLERAINDAPRPAAPRSGTFPAQAVRGDPESCRAGGDERPRVCDGTPGERRAGTLPSGHSVGAPRKEPSADSAVQSRRSGGSGHAGPKNRWLQDTRGPLPRARPMRETPQRSWVSAPGKTAASLRRGDRRGKKTRASPRGLAQLPGAPAGAPPRRTGGAGGRPGAEGAAVPPWGGRNTAGCAEAAATISRRTVPPMESTWNSPGRRGRAGKCSVSERHCRDAAGLCPPLPGRDRGTSEGLSRHGPPPSSTGPVPTAPARMCGSVPGAAARPDRDGR